MEARKGMNNMLGTSSVVKNSFHECHFALVVAYPPVNRFDSQKTIAATV